MTTKLKTLLQSAASLVSVMIGPDHYCIMILCDTEGHWGLTSDIEDEERMNRLLKAVTEAKTISETGLPPNMKPN